MCDPITLLTIAGGAFQTIGAAKSLFGSKKSSAPAPLPAPAELPPIPEPAVSPVADDQAIKVKKRRKFAAVRQRSGRLSTINTAPQGTVLG